MIKIIMTRAFLLCLILVSLLTTGCKKGEGTGGGATIQGKILLQDYTTAGVKNGDPYDGYDEKVYLVYGNGTTYDDTYTTSYDGSYKFTNLRTGTYKVFVYSAIVPVPSDPPKDEAIIKVVTVSDKKGVVTVETMTVNKF